MKFEPYVKWRCEKFGAVIFDTLREKVYVTNETGKDILPLIEKGKEVPEIIEKLAGEYDANADEIRIDVEDFVEEISEAGLLAFEVREEIL